ncbi:ferric reductase-like transmembrane domain-containing protein [Paenibacillus sp. y28]|uniref:ferric reductase-like transmembrane domain-containing protein n=1 Tax=Paenibacillus sp. y28 TaxID=3129110 RepID=UPI0030161EE1
MAQLLTSLPTWWIIRVCGLAAYALLFIGVATGIMGSMPFWRGAEKARLYRIHSSASNIGLVLSLIHVLVLVIDRYQPFALSELLIPFTSSHRPIFNGMGTLALYGLLLLIVTTDFKGLFGQKLWRVFHLSAYPVFALAMLHGLGTGTDSKAPLVIALYGLTCAIVVILTGLRVYLGIKQAGGQRNAYFARGGRHKAGHAD